MKAKKGFTAAALALVMTVAPILSTASLAADEEPTPKLTFSGIEIAQAADNSYQAVYALRLEDVDALSVGFSLNYDDTLLTPSDFTNNTLLTEDTVYQMFDPGFDGASPFIFYENGALDCDIVYNEDEGNPEAVAEGNVILGTADGGALVGRFSFRVEASDLPKLAAMTRNELKQLVTLNPEGSQPLDVTYYDAEAPGGYGSYYDPQWIVKVDLTTPLSNVEANVAPGKDTVNAQVIYANGDKSDLFEYVKNNSTSVTLTYADGSASIEPFTWSVADMVLEPESTVWDAKGGTYTVTQDYLDTGLKVTAVIEVTPVTVLKFAAEPATQDYITYDVVSDPTCKPLDWSGMSFPTSALPVYSQLLVDYTPVSVTVNNDWAQTDPDSTEDNFFNADARGEYTFQASVDTTAVPPWATLPMEQVVEVQRFLGIPTPTPSGITAVVDDNGDLTITVSKLGDSDEPNVPEGTEFFVRLPDGTDVTVVPENVTITDGTATVKIPHDSIPTPKTGEAINLGADDSAPFQVAAQITDPEQQGRSEFADCTFDPRNNYYEAPSTGSEYTFDYSGTNKGMFPFPLGSTLSDEITLPGTDFVNTTYDGVSGADNGKLQTIKVDQWTLESGDPDQEGEVLIYSGNLVDNIVAGFGAVQSRTPPMKITLKLQTVSAQEYSVTLKTDPADGTQGTLAFDDNTLSSPTYISANAKVSLRCVPAEGFSVVWVTSPSGIVITQDTTDENLYTFTMPNSDVTITARFTDGSASQMGELSFYGKTQTDDDPEDTIPPVWTETLIDTLYTEDVLSNGGNTPSDSNTVTTVDPEVSMEYWIRVSNPTEQLKILLTTPTAGQTLLVYEPAADGTLPSADDVDATASVGGNLIRKEVSATVAGETDCTANADTIPLEVAVEASVNDFLVAIVSPDGNTKLCYTIHVQRLNVARIELNYGNSPYGLIMADDAITDKEAAKQAFVDNGNQFESGNLPEGAYSNVVYTAEAWGDEINIDRDEHAIFVYNEESFRDPGFVAVDSLGNKIAATSITRTITVNRMTRDLLDGLNGVNTEPDTITIDGVEDNYLFTEITSTEKRLIRPDLYSMTYSFIDPTVPEEDPIEVSRCVVILNIWGDADNTGSLTSGDSSAIASFLGGRAFVNYPNIGQNIFKFRVMDTDMTGSITSSDASRIANALGGGARIRFYMALA